MAKKKKTPPVEESILAVIKIENGNLVIDSGDIDDIDLIIILQNVVTGYLNNIKATIEGESSNGEKKARNPRK